MKTIFDPERYDELLLRIGDLEPDSPRQWGRMTPHEAVCHLSDSFKAILGDRPLPSKPPTLKRRVMRLLAFTLPVPWPKGVRTSPGVNPKEEGTRPGDFEDDVEELRSLMERFAATGGRDLDPHYAWGDLSSGEWGRYAYRHLDHHLRQFGA